MIQGALAGLAAGGLYATIAVCLTIMARLVRVVNFSQVAVGMFGAFTAVALAGLGLPMVVSTVAGIVVGSVISAIIGLIIATWLADASITVRSAVSVAALLMLVALSFILFGTKPLPFTPILSGAAFRVGTVVISQITVALVIIAVLIAVLAKLLLSRTAIGMHLRALSDRPITAELVGIRSTRLSVGVWAATGALATLVVSIVAPSQSNDASSLALAVIPGAAAALAGGFRRLDLAVVGGLVLGMVDGALAQADDLTIVRYFVPFIAIVVLLLWTQRKEVWDAAR
ncbi:branched-chain amino acid ABC transporter permease [Microbacterium sp. VKM Ac-2870]|uniref:branched-chain amino acid ABC transporter permease n=1 Tax=Microbacterium sp. VKM Ac-2870 TaxID=2783825 RepID=UPI00188C3F88|nr:branched-chain amino acid ABC transporter permease [Microbacterium sp. VKM Ac-2870]MBF4562821.1 branched-chain amino acid ABC transporter permease [Microbacterium sp. VKM Ac-2870]